MNKSLLFSSLIVSIVSSLTHTVVREYPEDGFYAPADQALSERVESVAQRNTFTIPYEIAIPKKSALEMNVWNRGLATAKNSATGNPFIVINPPWFTTLSADEQQAILSVSFQLLKDKTYPYFSTLYLPHIHTLIGIIMIFIMMTLVGRIAYFACKPRYYGIIAAILINGLIQQTIIKKTLSVINNKLADLYAERFIQQALNNTHNKQAMINVYEKLLAFTNQLIKEGEKNLEAFAEAYSKRVEWLKNTK